MNDLSRVVDEGYFSISVLNYVNRRNLDSQGNIIFEENEYPVSIEKCGNNVTHYVQKFNRDGNFSDKLHENNFESSYCFKDNDLVIGGHFITDYFSNIEFSLKRCTNTTEYQKCKSNEDIDQQINSLSVSFIYLNYVINSTNFDSPFQPYIDNYWLTLDSSTFQFIDLYFSLSQVKTDKGWIFEDNSIEQRFVFDILRIPLLY